MPISLLNLKNILLFIFGAGIFIVYFGMKFEIHHLHSELQSAYEEQDHLASLLNAQNKAVVEWQAAAFAKDKELMVIEKKIDADRKKSEASMIEMMKIKIPGGSQGAINWLIKQSQIGK